jgi:phytanoyl-CoA dioxygenase PhyH
MDQTVENAESRTQTARELGDALRSDGFVVFRKFLPLADVEQARAQIAALYERDLEERRARGISDYHHDGAAGHSILTKPTHLLLDLYGKSPALDRIFERILTDPVSSAVLEELCGGDIKLRGYNCTRLTGEYDPAPALGPAPNPHEWHRDSFGEIGFGIFLDDFPGPNHGTTALMRGSHVYPYDPRWHTLFGPPHPPNPRAYKYNPFSRLLARKLRHTMTGAYGRRGDFYIFINDTWHGREPNLERHAGLRVMIGAFAADVPYPDRVADLAPEVLAKLPPSVRRVAPQPRAPVPAPAKRILDDVLAEQKRRASETLFTLTRLERKLAEWRWGK